MTGTKGKSTTSSIIGHLLGGLGYRAMVGGNFGAAPYDPQHAGDYDYWVIEVSSYTATDLASTPPVTAVTSLHPDHLPWHGGVERYYRDKLSACSQPGAELTVANGDSDLLRERAGLLAPKVEWVSEDDEPGATWMEPLGLPGGHNRRNALIARRVLAALGNAAADRALADRAGDDAALRRAAEGFTPLPSRLTTVGTVDGVAFVDDSLSTNVLPTLAALDAFPGRRVALIVGGQDRGIDYAPLAAGVRGRTAPTLVLTLPDSGPRISAAFASADAARGRPTPPRPAEWRSGGRDRLRRPGLRRRGGPSRGRARTGSCSSRPPPPASAASATTATGATSSPPPCAPARPPSQVRGARPQGVRRRMLAGRLRQPLEPSPPGPATLAHELLHPHHPRVGLDGQRVHAGRTAGRRATRRQPASRRRRMPGRAGRPECRRLRPGGGRPGLRRFL